MKKVLRTIRKALKSLHLQGRFFRLSGGCVVVFALSFPYPILFPAGQAALLMLIALTLVDLVILYQSEEPVVAKRSLGKLFSLGDDNPVRLSLSNKRGIDWQLQVYDELPTQLQQRDFEMKLGIKGHETRHLRYAVHPSERGIYVFGKTNVLIKTKLGLVARRLQIAESQSVPVYPSILQMKKFELLAFARTSNYEGVKKMRKLGHSYEFEQIRTYVQGDDIRSINWKATSRKNQLMVNQYQDERSQAVYSIIDKSRSMHMPFNGMSLLDYAVNTSLMISNIALKKHDRAGLITFSNTIGSTLRADRSAKQLKTILSALYNERAFVKEANYDLLYRAVKNVVNSRSLLFLYCNFESVYAMERALPILRKINRQHLLVAIIFENTELEAYSRKAVEFMTDVYTQTIADKLILEKKHMVMKLQMHGIQSILTKPEDLNINTLNKYLELKARGLI